jgi:hypothetical protein
MNKSPAVETQWGFLLGAAFVSATPGGEKTTVQTAF